jgi:replication factor A1
VADNYTQLVERISELGKISKEELERKIDAKRAKLSHLVSKEGAAQIVAAELGLNLEQEKLKLNQLVHGMKKANVVGKIMKVFPVREFEKNGRSGKVCNLLIGDESSNTRLVLWDVNHIALVENGDLKEGDVVEIANGGVRNGELHLGSFSDIKKSSEKIENVVEGRVFVEKKLKDMKSGETIKARAFVVQSFEPRYFEVNKETGRKITDEERKAGKEAEKRALMSVVLDDGTETIRAVIFGEEIEKLGLSKDEIFDLNKFQEVKTKVLGEEKMFCGNVRENQLYNTTEFVIEKIEDFNSDELVKELEAKV